MLSYISVTWCLAVVTVVTLAADPAAVVPESEALEVFTHGGSGDGSEPLTPEEVTAVITNVMVAINRGSGAHLSPSDAKVVETLQKAQKAAEEEAEKAHRQVEADKKIATHKVRTAALLKAAVAQAKHGGGLRGTLASEKQHKKAAMKKQIQAVKKNSGSNAANEANRLLDRIRAQHTAPPFMQGNMAPGQGLGFAGGSAEFRKWIASATPHQVDSALDGEVAQADQQVAKERRTVASMQAAASAPSAKQAGTKKRHTKVKPQRPPGLQATSTAEEVSKVVADVMDDKLTEGDVPTGP